MATIWGASPNQTLTLPIENKEWEEKDIYLAILSVRGISLVSVAYSQEAVDITLGYTHPPKSWLIVTYATHSHLDLGHTCAAIQELINALREVLKA